MLRSRRMLVIVVIGAFLISAELLAFRSLNHSLDKFAHSTGTLFQRLNVAVDVVSAASKLVPQHASGSGSFRWNWRDSQELKADESLRNAKLTNNERKEMPDAVTDHILPIIPTIALDST